MAITVDIELKNFRCFEDSSPARFTLKPGFTAFIGKNNSGKSTALRLFYELRNLFQVLANPDTFVSACPANARIAFTPAGVGHEPLFFNRNERDLLIGLRFRNPVWDKPDLIPARVAIRIFRNTNTFQVQLANAQGNPFPQDTQFRLRSNVIHASNVAAAEASYMSEAFRLLADTLYIGSFRNAINAGSNPQFYDIPVGQAFVKHWKQMQAGTSHAQGEAAHRLKHEIRKIFEFDELEIIPSEDELTLRLMIDGKRHDLLHVGSGIAHFLMVLATASVRRPAYIMIDEPELSLHAALQADFLETLGSYASEGVLFATHSLGLARTTADSIYSVTRRDSKSQLHIYDQTPRLAEFVGALSFAGTPDLGFDRILLVEGPTDARALQQLLRRQRKEHLVMMIPLGGSSGIGSNDVETQLIELRRITQKIFALIDSEKSGRNEPVPTDRQRFLGICRTLDIDCHVLQRRALENYFSQDAIDAGIGPGRQALGHFDSLSDASLGWAKASNWKIARVLRDRDLEGTDLEAFLNRLCELP